MRQSFKKIEKAIKRWYLMLVVGVIFIVLGIWTLATPVDAYIALSFVFAMGFLVSGITEMVCLSNKHQN